MRVFLKSTHVSGPSVPTHILIKTDESPHCISNAAFTTEKLRIAFLKVRQLLVSPVFPISDWFKFLSS